MELRILLRVHLLDIEASVENAEDKDSGAAVEAPDNGIRHHAFRCGVGNANPSEENREEITEEAACIAQEALGAVRLGLLLLADHVAHHHLERLHRHIDGGVEEDEAEQAKPHRAVESEEGISLAEVEAARIRKQQHHQHGNYGSYQKIWLAPSQTAPGLVRPLADKGLDNHTHQRREYPKEAQLVRICTESRKDAGNVRRLQGIRYLYAEKSEVQIEYLTKRECFI